MYGSGGTGLVCFDDRARLLERIVRDGYSLEYGVRPLRQVGMLG
jgi:hypothetical protein